MPKLDFSFKIRAKRPVEKHCLHNDIIANSVSGQERSPEQPNTYNIVKYINL